MSSLEHISGVDIILKEKINNLQKEIIDGRITYGNITYENLKNKRFLKRLIRKINKDTEHDTINMMQITINSLSHYPGQIFSENNKEIEERLATCNKPIFVTFDTQSSIGEQKIFLTIQNKVKIDKFLKDHINNIEGVDFSMAKLNMPGLYISGEGSEKGVEKEQLEKYYKYVKESYINRQKRNSFILSGKVIVDTNEDGIDLEDIKNIGIDALAISIDDNNKYGIATVYTNYGLCFMDLTTNKIVQEFFDVELGPIISVLDGGMIQYKNGFIKIENEFTSDAKISTIKINGYEDEAFAIYSPETGIISKGTISRNDTGKIVIDEFNRVVFDAKSFCQKFQVDGIVNIDTERGVVSAGEKEIDGEITRKFYFLPIKYENKDYSNIITADDMKKRFGGDVYFYFHSKIYTPDDPDIKRAYIKGTKDFALLNIKDPNEALEEKVVFSSKDFGMKKTKQSYIGAGMFLFYDEENKNNFVIYSSTGKLISNNLDHRGVLGIYDKLIILKDKIYLIQDDGIIKEERLNHEIQAISSVIQYGEDTEYIIITEKKFIHIPTMTENIKSNLEINADKPYGSVYLVNNQKYLIYAGNIYKINNGNISQIKGPEDIIGLSSYINDDLIAFNKKKIVCFDKSMTKKREFPINTLFNKDGKQEMEITHTKYGILKIFLYHGLNNNETYLLRLNPETGEKIFDTKNFPGDNNDMEFNNDFKHLLGGKIVTEEEKNTYSSSGIEVTEDGIFLSNGNVILCLGNKGLGVYNTKTGDLVDKVTSNDIKLGKGAFGGYRGDKNILHDYDYDIGFNLKTGKILRNSYNILGGPLTHDEEKLGTYGTFKGFAKTVNRGSYILHGIPRKYVLMGENKTVVLDPDTGDILYDSNNVKKELEYMKNKMNIKNWYLLYDEDYIKNIVESDKKMKAFLEGDKESLKYFLEKKTIVTQIPTSDHNGAFLRNNLYEFYKNGYNTLLVNPESDKIYKQYIFKITPLLEKIHNEGGKIYNLLIGHGDKYGLTVGNKNMNQDSNRIDSGDIRDIFSNLSVNLFEKTFILSCSTGKSEGGSVGKNFANKYFSANISKQVIGFIEDVSVEKGLFRFDKDGNPSRQDDEKKIILTR